MKKNARFKTALWRRSFFRDVICLSLCTFLLFFSIPTSFLSAQEHDHASEDSSLHPSIPIVEGEFLEGSDTTLERDFFDAPTLSKPEVEGELNSLEDQRNYERVTLDYAMAQSASGEAVIEVIEMESLNVEGIQNFRSATYEHALFLLETDESYEAVYISSGDRFHVRAHEMIVPYLEDAVFAIHNHPNGEIFPGPSDFQNAVEFPFWEAVGTSKEGWVGYNQEGVLEEGLGDEEILIALLNFATEGLSSTEELSHLRQELNALLFNFGDLQRAQVTLTGNDLGEVIRSAPHVMADNDEAFTNDRNVTLNFGDIATEVTHVKIAFNSTEEAAYGSLLAFSTVMQVIIPNFIGLNFVNVKLFNAAGEEIGFIWDSIELKKPTVHINADAAITNSKRVKVNFTDLSSEITQVRFAVNGMDEEDYGPLQALSQDMEVPISSFVGPNFLNAKFHNAAGDEIAFAFDSIEYKFPTMQINGGVPDTTSRVVNLTFQDLGPDVTHLSYAFNQIDSSNFSALIPVNALTQVTLPPYFGNNYVTVRFHNAQGDVVKWAWKSIQLKVPSLGGNLPPSVSQINHDAVDAEPGTPGLQVEKNSTVIYSAIANDPDQDPMSYQWFYTVNGGPEIAYGGGDGFVQDVSFDYGSANAGDTYEWILRVSDESTTAERRLTVHIVDSNPVVFAISNVTAVDVQSGHLTLTWQTNEPAEAQVQRCDANMQNCILTPLNTNLETDHSVFIQALAPDTDYFFRAYSRNAAGEVTSSDYVLVRTAVVTNQPPFIAPIEDQIIAGDVNQPPTMVLSFAASDPEGTSLSYTLTVKDLSDGSTLDLGDLGVVFNTAIKRITWQPDTDQVGDYEFTLTVTDADGIQSLETFLVSVTPPPICSGGVQVICDFLTPLYASGDAAGNFGDVYHNRDNFHSNLLLSQTPQVTLMTGGNTAELDVHQGQVVFGNSSTAFEVGEGWGSPTRVQLMANQSTADIAYQQYRNNNHYFYPEHIDHDTKDHFHAAFPYAFVSQGSSGTEIDEIENFLYASAALDPAVKQTLIDNGLLMPTLEMISRRSRVASDADYLTGAAHPSAFDNHPNRLSMVQMANQLTPSDIPPMVQLTVLEDGFDGVAGADYFEEFGATEQLFDTPAAISRIFRGHENVKRMVVSAEQSFDINGKPLTYEWAVLRGDGKVTINPLNPEGSVVEILIEHHPETLIAGDTRTSNLVEVGAFVHNGDYYSAPGFVTSFSLDNEERTYDVNGNLTSIVYNNNYVHPMLSRNKDWDRDDFQYDAGGNLIGWTRTQGSTTSDFTAEGHLVLERDVSGRPTRAKGVYYTQQAGVLTMVPDDNGEIIYEYESPTDMVGRISRVEMINFFGQVSGNAHYRYDSADALTHIELFNVNDQHLADFENLTDRAVAATPPGTTSPQIKISNRAGIGTTTSMALTTSLYFLQIEKAAESIASSQQANADDYSIDFIFPGVIPANPDTDYLGELQLTFRNNYDETFALAQIWTDRTFGWEYEFEGTQGFSVALLNENPKMIYHFDQAGNLLGSNSEGYEAGRHAIEMTTRRLSVDLPAFDISTAQFLVTTDVTDSNDDFTPQAVVKKAFKVQVLDVSGNLVKEYKVRELSVGVHSLTNEFYGVYDSAQPQDKYVFSWIADPPGSVSEAYTLLDGALTCLLPTICGSWT